MTTRPTLTQILDTHKQPRYADAGAAHQGDPIPMKECSACLGKVVWVQSTKTGKFYLADCYPYANDRGYYYVKASPHYKTCARRIADRQELETIRHNQTNH